MKRLSLFIILAACVIYTNAQTVAPASLINYKALENKLKKSNEAIENPKKNSDAKTWFSRGELFLEIYNINLQYLRKGMSSNEVKIMFGQPNQVQTRTEGQKTFEEYVYDRVTITLDGDAVDSWVETNKIYDNPLPEADKAFRKALELDADKKLSDKIKEGLVKLKQFYESEGIIAFNAKDYKKSYNYFDNVLKINDLPVMEGAVDTMVYYSAGRAAKDNGDCKTAVKMFDKTLEFSYEDPYIYIFQNECYNELGDSAKALETLQKGFKKHPDNQPILIALINFYLMRGESKAALDYLALAKQEDPTNISFMFAEGTIYDKLGRPDDAIAAYKSCLEVNPNYYNALFNLAVVYYNKAVKIISDAQTIEDNKIYNDSLKKAEQDFKNAIPYMESAKENAVDDTGKCDALSTLKTLYYRIKENEKMQACIDEMTMNGCP